MPVTRSIVLSSMLASAVALSLAMLILAVAGRQALLGRTQNSIESQLSPWATTLAARLVNNGEEWQFQMDQAIGPSAESTSDKGVIGVPQAGLWLSGDDFISVRPLLDQTSAAPFMSASNLYAALVNAEGAIEWRSQSFGAPGTAANSGDAKYGRGILDSHILSGRCELVNGAACITEAFSGAERRESGRLFVAISDPAIAANTAALVSGFHLALIVISGLIISLQSVVLYFSFKPLERLRGEIALIKDGRKKAIESGVPSELTELVDGFNDLIAQESERRSRLRSSLERLAHVLRTPLAVLKSKTFSTQADQLLVHGQSDRMLAIVNTELTKLSLEQPKPLVGYESVEVQPVLQQIISAYSTLPGSHRDGAPLKFTLEVDPANLAFSGGLQDLQDIFGTLLENALRFASKSVVVKAQAADQTPTFSLRISDDGEGFSNEVLEAFHLGERLHSGASSGFGLSIVRSMVAHYEGEFIIENLATGGAMASVTLPRKSF